MHRVDAMDRLRLQLPLVVLLTLAAVGCTSSPWSSKKKAASPPPANAAPEAASASPRADSPADQQAIDAMMAEVDRLQVLDPPAREKLLQDLRQTEPQLRPLLMQQFRAALAYRQQVEQREAALARAQGPAREPLAMRSQAQVRPAAGYVPGQRPPEGPSREPPPSGHSAASDRPDDRPAASEQTPARDPRVEPQRAVPGERPAASDPPERAEFQDGRPLPGRTANEPAGAVRTVAYLPAQKASDDWQEHLAAAIRAKESSLSRPPQSADDMADHARLRMLYLLAGRRDDALRPIPAAPASMQDLQDFWLSEIYGLAVWLDAQRITDSRRRAEEAKRHLDKAVSRLAEMSPLVIRNLAFVTDVQSFGNCKPCKKAEFAAEEAVLLYAELDNLKSEETPKGFHTAWRISYRIFDSRGQMVVDHEPTASEEYCQNPRHDFFIACQFRLPKRIYPGKHSLHLTVEDLKSQKAGQSSIDFTVKQSGE